MPFQNFTEFVKFVDDNMTLTTGSKIIQFTYSQNIQMIKYI